MKSYVLFLLLLLGSCVYAQTTDESKLIVGDWNGLLEVQGMKLRLVWHVKQDESGELSATLDSPDQAAFGIPVTETTFTGGELIFRIPTMSLTYNGKPNEDFSTIEGTFQQSGLTAPLALSRKAIEATTYLRPQEPQAPFPYTEEAVQFLNEKDTVTLAGTLTLPKGEGPWPVAVLISGSGPQDRNEELMKHKPFWVIADHLTRQGIAVLRYDDRGVGESTGDFGRATSADFAADALAAVQFLQKRQDIDRDRIGLIGHSEGGMVAPIVGTMTDEVDFMVLLAGPGVAIPELMVKQTQMISVANGMDKETVKKAEEEARQMYKLIQDSEDTDQLKKDLRVFIQNSYDNSTAEEKANFGDDPEAFTNRMIRQLTSPWFIYFMKFDPEDYLSQVQCPVLALNGEKDVQVAADQNLAGIKQTLEKSGHQRFTIKSYPDLNHLFQHCETGAMGEYIEIEETFAPEVLTDITNWIKALE